MARYRAVPRPVADLRVAPGNDETTTEAPAAQADVIVEVPYRDLQSQAKEAGIAANQSREDLEAALAEADSDD